MAKGIAFTHECAPVSPDCGRFLDVITPHTRNASDLMSITSGIGQSGWTYTSCFVLSEPSLLLMGLTDLRRHMHDFNLYLHGVSRTKGEKVVHERAHTCRRRRRIYWRPSC